MKIYSPQTLLLFLLLSISIFSSAQSTPQTFWWNDAVFYEVFVRSFKDSDGDGKGDFKGLISKLDYLNDGDSNTTTDLGITAIWLMPIMQSPSYHGYDVTDYRTIEQDYGNNPDFKNFMTEAHNRGIKVIIDYVMNHTSSQHPWFQASSDSTSNKRNWYTWQKTNPGNKGPWNQQVWYPKNSSNYYAIFWSEMPDLNYNTQAVKDTMFDIARFWMEDMNVDGFRLDAVKYIFENGNTLEDVPATISFWQDFRSYYKSVDADAFAVGEAWTSTDKVAPYVNNNGLDFCFEFDLATAILNAANNSSTSALKTQMDKVIAAYPHLQYGTFLTNHDMNRTMNQLGNNAAKAKVAADLLLTLPGVPYIYYGEEIGMTGSGVDENKRTPLQWSNTSQGGFTTGTPWRAVNGDYTTKNIAAQQADANSLWNEYRKLIALRTQEAALRKGNYDNVSSSSSSVFSFVRQYGDEVIIVISNTSSSALTNVSLNLIQADIVAGNYKFVELQNGNQLPVVIDVNGGFSNLVIAEIPAQSTLIYKLRESAFSVNSAKSNNFKVYPVPATKEIFIQSASDFNGTIQYHIYDLVGNEIRSSYFNSAQKSFSCEDLSNGIYLLNLKYEGGSKSFKIVIQK
jgi:alpha-amylase